MNRLSVWLVLVVGGLSDSGRLCAQEGAIVRTYDLRGLLAAERPWIVGSRWLPGEGTDDTPRTGSKPEDPESALVEVDLMAILAQATRSPDGGSAAQLVVDGGILFATASEPAHQTLGTWVELCRQVFLEPVTLEVHLLPGTVLAGAKGRIPRDEVDALLRTVGPHPSYSCTGRVGATMVLQSSEGASYVRDFDVEVASKSGIFDPKLDVLIAGHAWSITTARCVDGRLTVTVVGRHANLVGSPRVKELTHRDMKGKTQSTRLQLPVLHSVKEGAVARLADGDAMLIGGDEQNGGACCIRLRRTRAIASPSGVDWAWFATGDLTSPALAKFHCHLRLAVPGDDALMVSEGEDVPHRVLARDQLLARLRAIPGAVAAEVALLPNDLLFLRGDEGQRRAAGEMLHSLSSLLVRDLTVEVRHGHLNAADAALACDGRLDPGELAAKLPGQYLTTTLLQDQFHRFAVLQHAYVRDHEVEIANEAAVPNPVIGSLPAGIAISGQVMAAARDQYRLFLEVSFAELVGDIETFDLKDEDLGHVELSRLRDVKFEVSPLVDAGRWTQLYLAPLPGTSEHFAVVARVRE